MFLIRHGETEFNVQRRMQGRFDSPLTPTGVAQAEAIGDHLRSLMEGTDGWIIESSPLRRTVATAEIIRRRTGISSDVIMDDRLREVSMGSWDGLLREEIEERWPGALGPSLRESWVRACPDGETIDAVMARLSDWLRSHAERPNRLVVSHGISGSLIRGIYARLPQEEMLRLLAPQDSFYQLYGGTIQHIRCTVAPLSASPRPAPGVDLVP
jgi:broad specificity phosphatase PhoE